MLLNGVEIPKDMQEILDSVEHMISTASFKEVIYCTNQQEILDKIRSLKTMKSASKELLHVNVVSYYGNLTGNRIIGQHYVGVARVTYIERGRGEIKNSTILLLYGRDVRLCTQI